MSHHRETITAPGVPTAGPYSHAVRTGGLLFCSGQVHVDFETDTLVEGGASEQARRCLENLDAVARAGGASLADAVRLTVYLTDMDDFAGVNEAFGGFFSDAPPSRTTIAVAALPRGARIEIDAIVAMPD